MGGKNQETVDLEGKIAELEGRIKELDEHAESIGKKNGKTTAIEMRSARPMILDIGNSLPQAKAQFEAVAKFVKSVLKPAVNADKNKGIEAKDGDYGTIPGVEKPFLFKSGAEKIAALFGYAPIYRTIEKIEDWNDAAPMFFYRYECELKSKTTGNVMGSGIGSCNSKETKYRWRLPGRQCAVCHNTTVIRGRKEFGGGWICLEKRGGCGERYPDDNNYIVNQTVERIENPDICDLVNTIDKMAQKRALVAAVLIATGSSALFTQDDDVVDPATLREKYANATVSDGGGGEPVAGTVEAKEKPKDGWIEIPEVITINGHATKNPEYAEAKKLQFANKEEFRKRGYRNENRGEKTNSEGQTFTDWRLMKKLPAGVTKGVPKPPEATAQPPAETNETRTEEFLNNEIMAHFHRLKWPLSRFRAAVKALDPNGDGDPDALSPELKSRLLDAMSGEKI